MDKNLEFTINKKILKIYYFEKNTSKRQAKLKLFS
jgi:hypothetical protein